MLAFKSISGNQYDNMGGIPAIIWFALHDDYLTFPTVVKMTDVSVFETLNEMSGVPVMKAGKCWLPIAVTFEKGSLEDALQGEIGGKSHKSQLKFLLDGKTPENQAFARASNNAHMTFAIRDEDSGLIYTLGMTRYNRAMKVESKGGTGEGPAGKKGMEFTFECSQSGPAPYLKLTDSQIDILLTPAA